MSDKQCVHCRHTEDQHDEDGFCEKEDGVLGFCKCEGFEAQAAEGAD